MIIHSAKRTKTQLRHTHVDSIYLQVQSTMNQLAQRGVDVSQIFIQLKDVDAKYDQMDYVGALASVLQAQSTANNMMSALSQGTPPALLGNGTIYLILAASLGVLVGVTLAWLLMKRGSRSISQEGTSAKNDWRPNTPLAFLMKSPLAERTFNGRLSPV